MFISSLYNTINIDKISSNKVLVFIQFLISCVSVAKFPPSN